MGFYFPKRYVFALIAHFGFFVVYAMRVNLSVALVAMVNATYAHVDTNVDPECAAEKNSSSVKDEDGEFKWNQNEQGLILSSFFYGYLTTQILGGWMSSRYGGKWVFGIGVFATALLTMVTPVAAKAGVPYLLAVRILMGVGEGVTYPSCNAMLSKWAPVSERARMSTISFSGATSGTIIALPVCSLLADSPFLGGWPLTFYVPGIVGIIWFILWVALVTETPDAHSTISPSEKKFILDSQKNAATHATEVPVPWIPIFTSIRVWAIIVAHFSNNWVWYLVLTGLPSYFKQVLNFHLKENGFLSALPFIVAFTCYLASGVIADYLSKRCLSITSVRRLLGVLAFYSSALFLVLASYANCNQIPLSVTFMVLATGFLCFNNSGFNVNHMDIAPRFSGVLMGLTNTAGTISGCVTPLVTGYFTNDHPSRIHYRYVFLIAAGVSVAGGTFFVIFVSGIQQQWNEPIVKKVSGISNATLQADAEESPVPKRESDVELSTACQYQE